MYDHDLRTWYRDLFLLSARRRAARLLGRVAKGAQPDHDRGDLDEGDVMGIELVVAGRDAPELLEL